MSNKKIRVLFVDDEDNNLVAFKAAFRQKYEVFTAASAEEGLKFLDKNDVHIVITDQYLKETSGTEFLMQVMEKHPDTMRVLITGYAVIEDIIEAVNKTHIYAYISKPWEFDEVSEVIEAGYNVYKRRKEQKSLIVNLTRTNEQLEFMLRERLIS